MRYEVRGMREQIILRISHLKQTQILNIVRFISNSLPIINDDKNGTIT